MNPILVAVLCGISFSAGALFENWIGGRGRREKLLEVEKVIEELTLLAEAIETGKKVDKSTQSVI